MSPTPRRDAHGATVVDVTGEGRGGEDWVPLGLESTPQLRAVCQRSSDNRAQPSLTRARADA
jgi:hypothetical protein